jgi:hypothetical protein
MFSQKSYFCYRNDRLSEVSEHVLSYMVPYNKSGVEGGRRSQPEQHSHTFEIQINAKITTI